MDITCRLKMSTHPDNHYGLLTLGIGNKQVTLLTKNDTAWALRDVVAEAYRKGFEEAHSRSIQALQTIGN